MQEIVPAIVVVCGVATLFVACCVAIVRAAFFGRTLRADLLLAFYRTASFALAVLGCLALSESMGDEAAAAFSIAFCAASLGLGVPLARSWRAAEAAEQDRVEELRALVEKYRTAEASLESRCARAALEHDLTKREEEMLALLLEGRTRAEIARVLYVSDNTVKTHIRNLYRKMGVGGREDLAESMEAARDRRDGEGLLPSGVSDR